MVVVLTTEMPMDAFDTPVDARCQSAAASGASPATPTPAAEMDIDAGDFPIRGVENTDDVHNVVVCTLCSCYPRALIGLPPDWYKSRAYRSRTVREPRKVLAEFGTDMPDDIDVRVHDSTADLRFLVIPKRPEGTDDMSEEELATLVTRDSMIGVSVAKSPGA